uniref:Uncharacterized protein n=1 Tax=Anopheles atroparvus TaxID=41427 RepID=A0AAG5DRD3_ANOAO
MFRLGDARQDGLGGGAQVSRNDPVPLSGVSKNPIGNPGNTCQPRRHPAPRGSVKVGPGKATDCPAVHEVPLLQFGKGPQFSTSFYERCTFDARPAAA